MGKPELPIVVHDTSLELKATVTTVTDPGLTTGDRVTDDTGRTWFVNSCKEFNLDPYTMCNPPPPAFHFWEVYLTLRGQVDEACISSMKKL